MDDPQRGVLLINMRCRVHCRAFAAVFLYHPLIFDLFLPGHVCIIAVFFLMLRFVKLCYISCVCCVMCVFFFSFFAKLTLFFGEGVTLFKSS